MLSKEMPGAGAEVTGLDDVRVRNFRKICQIIKIKFPEIKTILDVGSSHGLFIRTATDEGFAVSGIEPTDELVKETLSYGYTIFKGFFPDENVLADKKFDAIIFNDSFEHIPNAKEIIAGIKKHLNQEKGFAIINIPTSDGLMFFISNLLSKFGIKNPLERLWQKGFASPHLHYFNKKNLKKLFEKNGFETKEYKKLYYYTLKGLWERLTCMSTFIVSLISWMVLVALYPLFVIKSDCFVIFFEMKEK